MSNFVNTYGRESMPTMVRGEGSYLIDSTGKKHLDFISGIAVNALGYGHPVITEAIKSQADKLIHCSNIFQNDAQNALAAKLVETSFAKRVFLCNSGTEANEAAIKFARKKGASINSSKTSILSFYEGFHGRTYGAMTATAQKRFHSGFHPLPAGYHYAPLNNRAATEAILNSADFAAVIIEPIQGEGGINSVDIEFLKWLREWCSENSTALIFDEIQCGVGRTGTLWAYESLGVTPDILTTAKPLGGGLPLGAVLACEEIASCIVPGDHGTTFGGNPVASAAGVALLEFVSQKDFLNEVVNKGRHLRAQLEKIKTDHPDMIHSVRGEGLLCGIRFTSDFGNIIDRARESGLLIVKAGNNTIRFIPPLTISTDEIDCAIDLFRKVLLSN